MASVSIVSYDVKAATTNVVNKVVDHKENSQRIEDYMVEDIYQMVS